jgi:prevent-host-death family protein
LFSTQTARTQLGQIIERATQNHERFVVGRRGEPSVIIMTLQDYADTSRVVVDANVLVSR